MEALVSLSPDGQPTIGKKAVTIQLNVSLMRSLITTIILKMNCPPNMLYSISMKRIISQLFKKQLIF